jgi:hypothetical protein
MRPRSLKGIRGRFGSFAEDKIVAFLKMMVDKKLMFAEAEKYLSLAVPMRLNIEDRRMDISGKTGPFGSDCGENKAASQ